MKLEQIHIQNFGRIKSATVKLSERGLVLVQGENLDDPSANSNGAGKSTIVEAISWVLYGKTAKGATGDSVINRQEKKNCSVTLDIVDDGVSYQIARGRKHKVLKSNVHVTTDDGKVNLTKGTDKLTQALIEEIIGCPYEVFTAAVYSGQEAMPDLPAMTDKQLKLLIEEAAGITLLEKAYGIANQLHREETSEAETIIMQMENATRKVDAAQDRVEDAKRSVATWDGEREARIMDYEANARILLDEAKDAKKRLEDCRPIEEIEEKEDVVKRKSERLDVEARKKKEHENEVAKRQGEATRLQANIETLVGNIKRKKTAYERLKDQIGEPCSSCGRNHDETSLGSAIEAAKDEQTEMMRDARALQAQLERAKEALKTAREKLDAYVAGMTDPTHLEAQKATLRAQRKDRETIAATLDSAKRRALKAVETVKKEREVENPFKETVKERKKEFEAAVDHRTELKPKLDAQRRKVAVAKRVAELYSPKGIRARILDSVTPFLNERTARYLGTLSDGQFQATWSTLSLTAKKEVREKFSIVAQDSKSGGTFVDMSGGEKRKIRLACALALQDLVSTRATKPIGIWIGDEIDAALDNAGLERLMNVLEEKAHERGTVLVISHTDLRDWISNSITVRRKDGYSEVVG